MQNFCLYLSYLVNYTFKILINWKLHKYIFAYIFNLIFWITYLCLLIASLFINLLNSSVQSVSTLEIISLSVSTPACTDECMLVLYTGVQKRIYLWQKDTH